MASSEEESTSELQPTQRFDRSGADRPTFIPVNAPPATPVPPVTPPSSFDTQLFEQDQLSKPMQDLSQDKLLLAAPRMNIGGKVVPMLGGIALLAKLGQGGMGAVYYGKHPRLQNEVAVKILPFMLAEQNPELIQRFHHEAKIAARIHSPHLVSVTDVNEEAGLFYLVMEYVDGLTAGAMAQQLTKSNGAMSERDALDVILGASTGLAVAHDNGVIHRDIKPDNIIVPKGRDGHYHYKASKLADLGLAKSDQGSGLTGTQAIMGTPGFMAPEQATQTKNAGKPADVFSMGAAFYFLLTGRNPFDGTSATELIVNSLQKPHRLLQEVRPDISPCVNRIVDLCLNKDPQERFQNADCLVGALLVARSVLDYPQHNAQGLTQIEAFKNNPDTGKAIARQIEEGHGLAGNVWNTPPNLDSTLRDLGPLSPGVSSRSTVAAHSSKRWLYLAGSVLLMLSIMGAALLKLNGAVPNEVQQEETVPKVLHFELVSGIGLELALIPSGEFLMGSPITEEGRFSDEGPRNSVKISKPFYLGITEVTQAQYREIMNENPSHLKNDHAPVESVSYEDALDFCQKLSVRIKRKVTLPTEAQWEYAARAMTQTPFQTGENISTAQANIAGGFEYRKTDPGPSKSVILEVAQYPPNAWGLYDMHGNVWEWCLDYYKADMYRPDGATDPAHSSGGFARVLRGGSYRYPSFMARTAARFWLPSINRARDCGFRILVEIEE